MMNTPNRQEAEEQYVCPMCGGDIDFDSPVVQATRKRIHIVAAMIPVGGIMVAGGILLAFFTELDPWGHGVIGFGIAVSLLSALYVKWLD